MREKTGVNSKTVGARIRKIRDNRTLKQFAQIIGVSHTSVKRYEEGTLPDADTLLKIAKEGKVDLGWLLLGKPLPHDVREYRPLKFNVGAPNGSAPAAIDENDYLTVPLIEGKIAAGNPRIAEEDVIDYFLLHARAFKTSKASPNLIACRVEGESMSPYLSPGDIVVVNRAIDKEKIDENKIYAVYRDGGVTAKTVQKEGYNLYLIPLNRAERIQNIDLRETENPIVGQVMAAWRSFEGGII